MVSKSMLNTLFQKQMTYAPTPQPYFTFRHGRWAPVSPDASFSRSTPAEQASLNSLRVITWNIDFMASQPRVRMSTALSHLGQLISTIPDSCAVVIHLQEMMDSNAFDKELCERALRSNVANVSREEKANDLCQIRNAPWVQEKFELTDITTSSWDAPYGQVTLIDRRLTIARVSRLRFVSEYQRDALFVDFQLSTQQSRFLRLCNVHLDSSYGSMRPAQWKALGHHLQDTDQGITASILAGDCNATHTGDRSAPQDHAFKDAYLELGGIEDDDAGATWGFQSLDGKRWGRQRLDKEVYWGDIRVNMLERIGVGVEVEDERARTELRNKEELTFATDHYGLMGEYTIRDGLKTMSNDNCDSGS